MCVSPRGESPSAGENDVINFFRSEEAKFNKELLGRSKFVVRATWKQVAVETETEGLQINDVRA